MRVEDSIGGPEKLRAAYEAQKQALAAIIKALEEAHQRISYWERKYKQVAAEFKKLNEAHEQLREDTKWKIVKQEELIG